MPGPNDDTPCLLCDDPLCATRRRPGEDGLRIRQGGACDAYRAFCSAPGYCWCGHWRERHADYASAMHTPSGALR